MVWWVLMNGRGEGGGRRVEKRGDWIGTREGWGKSKGVKSTVGFQRCVMLACYTLVALLRCLTMEREEGRITGRGEMISHETRESLCYFTIP